MNISYSGQWKSIHSLQWDDVPCFAVLTGRNGTGKSQFLELVHKGSQGKEEKGARISGFTLESPEVLYLKGEWTNLTDTRAVSFDHVQKHMDSMWGQFTKFQQTGKSPPLQRHLFQAMCTSLGKEPRHVTQEDFACAFDGAAPDAQTHVFNETIARGFLDYRMRQLESLQRPQALESPAPWHLLKELIQAAELPFTFNDPSGLSMRMSYAFQLTNTQYDARVNFGDLSSGEKVLLSLVFWMFHVDRTRFFPKLVLLDEPDAHLHPDMTRQFLHSLKSVLVDKYGVRIILTTHHPATVLLSPRESLFEMFPDEPRIRKVASKNETVRRLTAGVIDLAEAKRVVIVEDEDDERFFSWLYGELHADANCSDALSRLRKGVPLVFAQASRPRRDRKEGDTAGGRSEVEKWVSKLRDAGLSTVLGLVDRDNSPDVGPGIVAMARYSVENYLVDPLIVFGCLHKEGAAPEIPDVPVLSKNREHTIATWTEAQLQRVVEWYTEQLAPRVGSSDGAKVVVEFLGGLKLTYPQWLLDRRGKDLLGACHDQFGGQRVNRAKLTETFQRMMIVPQELVSMFASLKQEDACGAGESNT